MQESLAYTTTPRWKNIPAQKTREDLPLPQVLLTSQHRRGFSTLLTVARALQPCAVRSLQAKTMKSSHLACAALVWVPMSPQTSPWVSPNNRMSPKKPSNPRPRTEVAHPALQRDHSGRVHPHAGRCLDQPAPQLHPTPMSTSRGSLAPAAAATRADIPSTQHPVALPGVPTTPRT